MRDLNNPAPFGPPAGSKRGALTLHRRRRKQEVRARIRELRRAAANPPATEYRVPVLPQEVPAQSEADLLAGRTRDDLRAECKARGLSNYGKLNKAGLIALLTEES